MIIFADSSKTHYCLVVGGAKPIVAPHDPPGVTTNEGEYRAFVAALMLALARKPVGDVHILLDSQLVVRQFNGQYACNVARLLTCLVEAVYLANQIRGLDTVTDLVVRWIPREENLAGYELERMKK